MDIDASNATWLKPFDAIRRGVVDDGYWEKALGSIGADLPPCGIHLAVFVEPFLGYVLDGSKSVESRFSLKRTPPFRKVRHGDVVLIKRTGGPIVGIAIVGTVWFYRLDPKSWQTIRDRFAKALRADHPMFWESRENSEYATLMLLDQVRRIKPVEWEKSDRRGWVVVQDATQPSLF